MVNRINTKNPLFFKKKNTYTRSVRSYTSQKEKKGKKKHNLFDMEESVYIQRYHSHVYQPNRHCLN